MPQIRCERCPTRFPDPGRGRIPRFCSTRCRVAAHRARKQVTTSPLPAELRTRPRWVRRSATKVPLTPTGAPASSTDPSTWSTYEAAKASSVGAGTGLVLDGDGIVCLDIDHCLTSDGQLRPWARAVVDQLPATYTEVSPSGDGLHVFGHGRIDRGRRLQIAGGTVEVYGNGRYITVTEQPWHRAPARLADLSAVLADLL